MLHTNCVPSDDETVQIHQVVDKVGLEIAQLERDILREQDVLKKLERKCEELKVFHSDHLALLTPARRLIPEMLSKIFIQCLPSFNRLSTQTPQGTPMYLGQICSGWRAVALSIPKLWATFVMSTYIRGTPLLRHNLEHEWFSRSASHPLSLSISLSDGDERQIDAITRVSDRWSTVYFNMSLRNARRFSNIKTHLALLQHLKLGIFYAHHLSSCNCPLDIFKDAPRLHSLSIWVEFDEPIPYFTLKLPWSQLKQLHVMGWSRENSVKTLQKCTNLVHFTYKLDAWAAYGRMDETSVAFPSEDLVYLPCLQSIDLYEQKGRGFDFLLDHLMVSALRDVTVGGQFSPIACHQFTSLLQRSSCYVQNLHLQDFTALESQLMECLEHMPTFVELNTEHSSCITDNLILRLTHGSTKNLLAPKLQRFRIYTLQHLCCPRQLLVDMIQSRWGATDEPSDDEVANLQLFCVFGTTKSAISYTANNPGIAETTDDADIWSQLDQARAMGLDFHVDEQLNQKWQIYDQTYYHCRGSEM